MSRCIHSFNGILIGTYTRLYSTVSFRMTLSDLEWLSEIFNDTKHRAISLQQLSFLSKVNPVLFGAIQVSSVGWKINDAFLPQDAMRKRGLCCRVMSVRLSVCPSVRPSVTFIYSIETNKHSNWRENTDFRFRPKFGFAIHYCWTVACQHFDGGV